MRVKGFDVFQAVEDSDRVPPKAAKLRGPEAETASSVEETQRSAAMGKDAEKEMNSSGLARLLDFLSAQRRRRLSDKSSKGRIYQMIESYRKQKSHHETRGLWIDQKI